MHPFREHIGEDLCEACRSRLLVGLPGRSAAEGRVTATAPAGLRIRARALVRAKAEHGSHELAKLVPVFLSLGEIFAAIRAKRM
jgi:hypothetical protein